MKKITLAVALLFFAFTGLVAQDLKKAKTAVTLSQLPGAAPEKLEDAKTEVDKLVADPKGQSNAEAWMLKTQVYGMLAGNEAMRAKYPNASKEAFTALNRYLELDPENKKLAEAGFVGLNDIYRSFFDEGVKNYNSKTWDQAFENFRHLADVSDLMIKRKWTNTQFDTTAYLFAGIAAQNAKKEDQAIRYYKELADRKVKGQDYEHIYVFLPNYFSAQKQDADFNKYLAISKEMYPEKPYWADLEFEYKTGTLSLEDVAKQFDTELANNSLSAQQLFDYGNFFVSDKKIRDLNDADKIKYLQKSIEAFTKSAEKDSTNALAIYNVGVTTYSLWEDAADKARNIKGTTADIKAKRAQADKHADAAADKSIDWLERSYRVLNAKENKDRIETNSQKTSAKFLASLYEYKRERSKGNDAAYDKFDKKLKFYDTKY
ncbi:hypothetical protein [Aridibaculum aurantiacum]|uniref:hypothetical protein n=1 Tax=Aridibaculum aurantiacum TaxID=2810307 RepID=UPI001A970C9A|nr:hypothetical protein [Aridibaculum aurantiacum]